MTKVAFVSVNRSYKDSMSIDELRIHASRFWGMTLAKALSAERLVALYRAPRSKETKPVAVWRVWGAYRVDGTSYGRYNKKRIAFDLGEQLPILEQYSLDTPLRSGCRVVEIEDLEDLQPPREDWI